MDYAIKFSKVDSKVVKELYQKLNEYGLKPQTIIQIINIMPRTSDELKVILIEEDKFFSEEEVSRIIDLLNNYSIE